LIGGLGLFFLPLLLRVVCVLVFEGGTLLLLLGLLELLLELTIVLQLLLPVVSTITHLISTFVCLSV
jgi:hypothetical protein